MNCTEFREKITADPSFGGGLEHLRDCAGCRAFRSAMRDLDEKIHRALLVDVPELAEPALPDAGPTGDVLPLRGTRRNLRPAWFAVAATLIVAAFVGVRVTGSLGERALAEEVLAHVAEEPAALRVTDVAVSDELLQSVLPPNATALGHDAGLVTYARSCIINGHVIPHLVIQGQRGPVTILLLPEEHVRAAMELDRDKVQGVILPVGSGSVAIVGTAGEALDDIRRAVVESVNWET